MGQGDITRKVTIQLDIKAPVGTVKPPKIDYAELLAADKKYLEQRNQMFAAAKTASSYTTVQAGGQRPGTHAAYGVPNHPYSQFANYVSPYEQLQKMADQQNVGKVDVTGLNQRQRQQNRDLEDAQAQQQADRQRMQQQAAQSRPLAGIPIAKPVIPVARPIPPTAMPVQQQAAAQNQQAAIPGMSGTRSQDGQKNTINAVGLSGNTQLVYTAGEAYKMAGEGAFHLAKGIGFVTASSEQEIAVLVKKIAYYEGVFQIFKGGVDISNGLMRGTRALALSYSAEAVASAASTAAAAASVPVNATAATVKGANAAGNIAITTTAAAATVATGAQTAAMSGFTIAALAAKGASMAFWTTLTGPVGLALMGTAATAGVAYLAYDRLTGASVRAATAAKKLADDEHSAAVKRIQAVNSLSAVYRTGAAAQANYQSQGELRTNYNSDDRHGPSAQLRKLDADQAADRERNIKGLLSATDKAAGKTAFLGQGTGFNYKKNATAADFLGANNGDHAKLLQQMSQSNPLIGIKQPAISGMFDRVATQVEAEKKIAEWRQKATQPLGDQIAAQKSISEAAQREIGFTRERLGLLAKQLDTVNSIKTGFESAAIAAAKVKAGVGADKLTDLQKIGQMNPWDRQRAQQIGERLAAGGGDIEAAGLQKHEIDFMREHGLGNAAREKYEIKQGRAAGGEKILDNFGQSVVGEVEAKRTGLPAGERREDIAAFQDDFARAGGNQADSSAKDLMTKIQTDNKKEADLLKVLAGTNPKIQALEDAIKDRDSEAATMREALGKSLEELKKATAALVAANTTKSMNNRPTG
ncbi:MAG: hypothetical protein JWM11_3019 [Planctomycetaceae bacterium]|nr:hypothetical protein [Planctomycetaceae bacterium]